MRRLVIFAILSSLFAPANAKETYPTKHFGWWEVYGWDENCWMKASYEGGTQILFSWDAESPKMFVMFRNANWASIDNNRTYRVRIAIDGWGIYEDATGSQDPRVPPGISLYVDRAQEDVFLAKLYSGRSLELYVAERPVGSFSLKDSGAAVREMVKCTRASARAAEKDPFTQSI